MKFFEVKVRYKRVVDNHHKAVTETYAIAAQTFSDAEHKAIEAITPYAEGEVEVIAEKIALYNNYVYSDTPRADDKYYLVKYAIVGVNEDTGKVTREYRHVLIEAIDVESVPDVFSREISSLTSRELTSVKETNILEVFQ